VSGLFDDDTPEQAARPPASGSQQRSRALIGTIIVLVIAFFLISVFTGVWTDRLWFKSVGYSEVFTKVLGTKVLLFLVFGLLMGVTVAANVIVAYRFRPLFRPASQEQVNLDRYREVVDPLRKWLLIVIAVVLGLFAGGSGSGQWRQFLMWRHGGSFGTKDPYFHLDVGFYVFDLPWLHYLVDFAMAVIVLSLIAAAVVHYLFGGIRLQVKQDRLSGAAQVQISVLAGFFVLFKALDYWLDRYNLTNNGGGLFTGIGFSDKNAVLPSKTILTIIAIICAVLFFANVLRRTWLLPSVGLVLLVLSSILLGVIWPGIVQQFQVKPSEPDKEGPYIARNIQATRAAFDIPTQRCSPTTPTSSSAARSSRRRPRPSSRACGCSTRRWCPMRSSSCSRCGATTASRRCWTWTATRSRAAPATWSSPRASSTSRGFPKDSATGRTSTRSTRTASAWSRRTATRPTRTTPRFRTTTTASRSSPSTTCPPRAS